MPPHQSLTAANWATLLDWMGGRDVGSRKKKRSTVCCLQDQWVHVLGVRMPTVQMTGCRRLRPLTARSVAVHSAVGTAAVGPVDCESSAIGGSSGAKRLAYQLMQLGLH